MYTSSSYDAGVEPVRQRAVLAAMPYLVAFAQTGQVSLAAAVLGVPQPTVSRGLARLNELVGVPLTVREGRGLRLTRDGESFVRHAESAVGTVTAALAELDGRGTGADEEISIAYLNTLGSTTVPVLLRAFLAERPRTRVTLWVGSRGQCLTRLEDRTAHVAVVSHPPAGPGVQTVALYTESLIVLVPAGHRLAGRPRVRIGDLDGEPIAVVKPGYGLRDTVDNLFAHTGRRARIAFEGDDVHTLAGLVAAGLAVSVLPASGSPPAGTVEIALDEPGAVRQLGAAWLDEPAPPWIEQFRSLLRRRGAAIARSATRS